MQRKELPVFDPKMSGEFAANILNTLHIDGILIGRLAVWAYLSTNSDKQAYTKDLDIAVSKASIFEIKKHLHEKSYKIRDISIGGINVKNDEKNINVDFIDRSSTEWGDYSLLFGEAIKEAIKSDRAINVGGHEIYLVSVEYLITMKLATGERKDENDLIAILTENEMVDIKKVRSFIMKYLGEYGVTRFEIILRDINHTESRLLKYNNRKIS